MLCSSIVLKKIKKRGKRKEKDTSFSTVNGPGDGVREVMDGPVL